jgi:hypothetical protein
MWNFKAQPAVFVVLVVCAMGCSSKDDSGSGNTGFGSFPQANNQGPLAGAGGVAGAMVLPGTAGAGGSAAPTGGAGSPSVTPPSDSTPPDDTITPPTDDTITPPADDEVVPPDTTVPPMAEDHCLAGITSFDSDGPFSYNSDSAGSVKLWVPDVPAGCKVPVIHLANGTGATCSAYLPVLQRFASHGFLTTCYENPNTGAGTQGLMAFQTAVSMYPDMADMRFGSTGHSQGGQAAFTVLQLTEAEFGPDAIYAGLAMEPASGFGTQPSGGTWQQVYAKIRSPMFMFSGTADVLVSQLWVTSAFNALDGSIEAYHWSAAGATHIPVPNAPTQEVGVPWFRWKLLGDQAACKAFKALRDGSGWSEVSVQNEEPCQ